MSVLRSANSMSRPLHPMDRSPPPGLCRSLSATPGPQNLYFEGTTPSEVDAALLGLHALSPRREYSGGSELGRTFSFNKPEHMPPRVLTASASATNLRAVLRNADYLATPSHAGSSSYGAGDADTMPFFRNTPPLDAPVVPPHQRNGTPVSLLVPSGDSNAGQIRGSDRTPKLPLKRTRSEENRAEQLRRTQGRRYSMISPLSQRHATARQWSRDSKGLSSNGASSSNPDSQRLCADGMVELGQEFPRQANPSFSRFADVDVDVDMDPPERRLSLSSPQPSPPILMFGRCISQEAFRMPESQRSATSQGSAAQPTTAEHNTGTAYTGTPSMHSARVIFQEPRKMVRLREDFPGEFDDGVEESTGTPAPHDQRSHMKHSHMFDEEQPTSLPTLSTEQKSLVSSELLAKYFPYNPPRRLCHRLYLLHQQSPHLVLPVEWTCDDSDQLVCHPHRPFIPHPSFSYGRGALSVKERLKLMHRLRKSSGWGRWRIKNAQPNCRSVFASKRKRNSKGQFVPRNKQKKPAKTSDKTNSSTPKAHATRGKPSRATKKPAYSDNATSNRTPRQSGRHRRKSTC